MGKMKKLYYELEETNNWKEGDKESNYEDCFGTEVVKALSGTRKSIKEAIAQVKFLELRYGDNVNDMPINVQKVIKCQMQLIDLQFNLIKQLLVEEESDDE